jgi:hypothetical protein
MQPETIEGKIIRDADKLDFVSPERWEECVRAKKEGKLKDLSFLKPYFDLLPKVRNEFLQLPVSKKIYQRIVGRFLSYMRICDDREIKKYTKAINLYNLR